MKKIALEDVKDIAEYERIREDYRRRIIGLKKRRRIPVGEIVTLVFENRETVLFQIQEMLRVERIAHEDKIRQEIETYNEMIPGEGELSATLFIEIDHDARLREWLPRLVEIERSVALEFPDASIARAVYEAGRSTEDKTSTVHYLKFPLSRDQARKFIDPSVDVFLTVHHPHYEAKTPLTGEPRQSLIEDLLAE